MAEGVELISVTGFRRLGAVCAASGFSLVYDLTCSSCRDVERYNFLLPFVPLSKAYTKGPNA